MHLSKMFWATDSVFDGLVQPQGRCETTVEVRKNGVVVRLHHRPELTRAVELPDDIETRSDLACGLCERLVCLKLDIPFNAMRARTRSCADVALARQIAMYLAHTKFSVLMTEVGLYFGRDRTTVAYACASVEDRRDDLVFDTMLCQLEETLEYAVCSLGAETIEDLMENVR